MSFKFEYNKNEIIVDEVSDKIDDWVVKKSEVIEYSKDKVIVEAFEKQFPQIKILGNTETEKFDYITNLVSRSDKLLQWFALEKIKYSELAQLPSYLNNVVNEKEFKTIQKKITSVNNVISDYAKERTELTAKYKSDLKRIDERMNSSINEKIGNDKIVKVLTLSSQSLPLSIVNAIESYNAKTSDSDFDEKRKLYGREMLTKFKVAILKKINENPDIDVDDLIDKISLK